tara:strand:- start:222 stop:359 length:138 start_codon:yes stop_codon:yes gene_type:complete
MKRLNNGESEILTAYIKLNLAVIKFELGDKKGSCEDYRHAIKSNK